MGDSPGTDSLPLGKRVRRMAHKDKEQGIKGGQPDHYFAPRPDLPHRPREFTTRLRGEELTFLTDAGVFSRGRVDPGTRLLAEAMEIGPADTVLDLGCGYGPLGMVAARLAPHGRVYLVDVNPRATALAQENLKRNRIDNAQVLTGDGLAPVANLSFDQILINPPVRAGKGVVYPLLKEAYRHLRPGGSLWVVIRTRQGAESLRRFLEEVFGEGEVEEKEKGGGYRVYRCRKRSVEETGEK